MCVSCVWHILCSRFSTLFINRSIACIDGEKQYKKEPTRISYILCIKVLNSIKGIEIESISPIQAIVVHSPSNVTYTACTIYMITYKWRFYCSNFVCCMFDRWIHLAGWCLMVVSLITLKLFDWWNWNCMSPMHLSPLIGIWDAFNWFGYLRIGLKAKSA